MATRSFTCATARSSPPNGTRSGRAITEMCHGDSEGVAPRVERKCFLTRPSGPGLRGSPKSKQTGSGLRVPRAFPVVMAFILPRSDASFIMGLLSGSNSVVECDLAKVEVAGSNPVSRSTDSVPGALCWRALCMFGSACWTSVDFFGIWRYLNFRARYPSGKGEVCKTFMRRFDSDPRLHRYFL